MPDNRPNNSNNTSNRNRGPSSNVSSSSTKTGYTNAQVNSATPNRSSAAPTTSTPVQPPVANTPMSFAQVTQQPTVASTPQPVPQQQQPVVSQKRYTIPLNAPSNAAPMPSTTTPPQPAAPITSTTSSTNPSSTSLSAKSSLKWAGKEFVPGSFAPKEFVPKQPFTPAPVSTTISVTPTPVVPTTSSTTTSNTILSTSTLSKNLPAESVVADYQKAALSLGRSSSAIDSHQLESHSKFTPYHSTVRPYPNPVPIPHPHAPLTATAPPFVPPTTQVPLPPLPVEPKKKTLAIVDPETGKDIITNTVVIDVSKLPKEEPTPKVEPKTETKVETKPPAIVISEEPKKEEAAAVVVPKEEPKKVVEAPKVEEVKKEEPKLEEPKKEEPVKEKQTEEKKEKKFEKLTIEVTSGKQIKAQEISSTSSVQDLEDSFYPQESDDEKLKDGMAEPPTPTTPMIKYRYNREQMKSIDKGAIDLALKEKFSAIIGPGKADRPDSAKTPRSPMGDYPSPGGKGKFGSYAGKNTGFSATRGGRPQGRGGKTQGRGAKTPVTAASVGLKTSENAWKAGKGKDEEAEIIKEVKFILNLLTPEKYDILIKNFLVIKIQSESLLAKIIDCVFEIAIIQPSYCEMYAKLCRDLSKSSELKIHDDNASQTEQTSEQLQLAAANIFRRKLLNKCQAEYLESIKRVKELHQPATPAPAAEEQPPVEQENGEPKTPAPTDLETKEEKEAKLKKRRIGIVTLIGELFVKQMLAEKVMFDVMIDLLHARDSSSIPLPEEIEMATKLITIIGKTWETLKDTKEKKEEAEKLGKFMTFIFQKFQALSVEKSYPSRIRFSLIDVVELRANNWVSRLKQDKVKKIDEVLQDIEKEKAEKMKKVQDSRSQGGRRGGRTLYANHSNASSASNLYETEKKAKLVVEAKEAHQAKKKREEEEEEEEEEQQEEEETRESSDDEEEDISQEVLVTKVKSEISSFFEDGDLTSVIKGLKVYIQKKRVETIIIAIKLTVEKSEAAIKDFIRLMDSLINDEESISGSKLAECIIEALKQIMKEDVLEDNPGIPKNLGTLCGLAQSIDSKQFSFDFIDSLITKVQQESTLTTVLIVDIISHYIKAKLSITPDAKVILKEASSSKFNFIHYINPSKSSDVDTYISKMHNADGAEKGEPISYVMFSIKEEKISAEKLSEWTRELLDVSPKAGAKILLAIITFCEAFTTFASGRLKLSEAPEKLLDKYRPVFELVLAKDGQYNELFTELNTYGIRIEFKNEVLKRVFSFLKDLKVKPDVDNLKKRADIAQEIKNML